MKNPIFSIGSLLFLLSTLFLPGCAVAGGIFKAGIWVGILAVIILIVIIMLIVGRSKK